MEDMVLKIYGYRSGVRCRSLAIIGASMLAACSLGQIQLQYFRLGPTQLGDSQTQAVAKFFGLTQEMGPNGAPLPVWQMGDGSVRQSFTGGVFHLTPVLKTENGPLPTTAVAQRQAQDFYTQFGLVPDDSSTWQVGDFSTWSKRGATPNGMSDIHHVIRTVRFQRMLNGLPCFGPTSLLSLDVDANGVAGLVASLRPAVVDNTLPAVQKKNGQQVTDEYNNQLQAMLKQNPGSATLISRTLCYFEQNANFIMPAYRFRVQIVGTNGEVTGGDIFILIGLNCPEFVGKSEFFGFPPPIPNSAPHAPAPPPLVNNVRLGEYVVRQDADQDICLNIANDFAGSAAFGSSIIGKSVTRTQYYWDEPWLWTPALGIADNSRFYPGSVDFAVIIAHGTGWEFSCLSNYGEWVDLHTMDHYGRNAPVGNVDQDYTSYMLFTSCDMIPAPGDPYSGDYTSGSPFDVWWNIFYGFHGIYGFRATAGKQACDDMFSNFALAMGVGQPNCAAWMNVTGSEDHGGGWNYGTAVIMSGFEGDTIYNTDARGAAGSLTIWWNHP